MHRQELTLLHILVALWKVPVLPHLNVVAVGIATEAALCKFSREQAGSRQVSTERLLTVTQSVAHCLCNRLLASVNL